MTWILISIGVALVLYGLHHLALWAERRGWIYYRHTKRPPGVGLGLLAPIYKPELEHVVEEGTSQRGRRDETDRETGDDD